MPSNTDAVVAAAEQAAPLPLLSLLIALAALLFTLTEVGLTIAVCSTVERQPSMSAKNLVRKILAIDAVLLTAAYLLRNI